MYKLSLRYTAAICIAQHLSSLLPGLAYCQPRAPRLLSVFHGAQQVNMPDTNAQELHGREADLHKPLHDLLQEHHKVCLRLRRLHLYAVPSMHALCQCYSCFHASYAASTSIKRHMLFYSSERQHET